MQWQRAQLLRVLGRHTRSSLRTPLGRHPKSCLEQEQGSNGFCAPHVIFVPGAGLYLWPAATLDCPGRCFPWLQAQLTLCVTALLQHPLFIFLWAFLPPAHIANWRAREVATPFGNWASGCSLQALYFGRARRAARAVCVEFVFLYMFSKHTNLKPSQASLPICTVV